jgi:hypothetical protein
VTPDQRISDLESRLDKYHEWLVEAIQERDRLALDAAWGVHYALYQNLTTVGILLASYIAFDTKSWWAWIPVAVALFASQFFIHGWSNGQRMKEVERLAKLPDWEWKG